MSRSRPSTGNAPPTTLTSIATPPHLARSTLPSSPSSARLRRVAPSPIRVPPTPPLRFSPPVRRNLYPSAHHGQPLTYTSKGPPIASPGASGFDFKAVEFHPDSLIPTPPPSGRPGLTMSDSGMHQWQLEAERTLEDCKSELPHDQSRNNSLSGTEVGVDRRESSVDSFWCAPLILDTRGEFGKMAERTMYMARGGPDVPEELLDDMELQVEIHGRERQAWTNPHAVATHQTPTQTPQNRTADKALTKATGPTPGEWIMSNVPAPVLVNFNEDVFGSAKAGKEVSPGTKTPWTPATQVINRSGDTAASSGGTIIDGHLAPDATPMDRGPSYTGSCATFGPRRRRSSVVADDDDAWSLSLSAYENNEGERSPEAEGSREGKGGNLAEEPVWSVRNDMWSAGYPQRISWSESTLPPHLQRQKDIHESSPASTITELITPDHPVAALPGSTRLARQDIDSPTHASIRAKAFQSQLDGLQLFTNQRNYESVQDGLSKLVTAPLPIPRSRRPTTSDARIPSPAPSTLLPPTIYRPGTSASSASTILPPLFDSFDQTTTIQLWIDQEGTREAHSILKFIRYIKPETWRQKEENSLAQTAAWCESPSRPQPHTFQQGGCLEFGMDPRRRDQWVFHHAALEALPVLRRVTVNEDDRYDYVGRGATLQIKEVGVYAIYGSEERGKVEWKFEYLVKPKVNKAGDDVPNEKVSSWPQRLCGVGTRKTLISGNRPDGILHDAQLLQPRPSPQDPPHQHDQEVSAIQHRQ